MSENFVLWCYCVINFIDLLMSYSLTHLISSIWVILWFYFFITLQFWIHSRLSKTADYFLQPTSSPIWLSFHCPKCLSLNHQITFSQHIYHCLGRFLRHCFAILGQAVLKKPATVAFCARFGSWMHSRCSPKMSTLYWSSLWVTGSGEQPGIDFKPGEPLAELS